MATIQDIGIPAVGTGAYQPKMANRWRVTFSNFGGGADSQPISMQASKATRPKITYEEVEIHRYNSRVWVAGKHNWDPMTITIHDDVAGLATSVIQAQHQRQQWIVGAEGLYLATAPDASAYKFGTTLALLDGGQNVIEEWKIEGCWLREVDYSEVAYETNAALDITMTIRFDLARQTVGNFTAGTGSALGGGL